MNKKGILLLFVLVVIIAGGVFAQEGGSGIKNWISGDVSLIGVGTRYERMLDENLSIGGTIFFHSFFLFWNSVGINVTARYYPWAGAGNFYAELDVGFGTVTNTKRAINGVMVSPGVGWKIDLGKPGAFYINPMISLPIVLGRSYSYRDGKTTDSGFKIGTNFRPAFGMGYAF